MNLIYKEVIFMIRSIALKEFFNNLVSARFSIGFVLCLFLVPFILFVSINDYKSQLRIYEVEKQRAESRNEVRVYSAFRPDIVKPPEPLSIFSKGISYNVGNRVRILLGEKPLLSTGRNAARENPHLNAFFTLDFISIIAILISLLALLFTYDTCSEEREQGTFKLLLSHSISRYKILLGKVIGVTLTLLPILVICYVLSILIVLLYGNLSFTINDMLRIVLLFCLSTVFFLLFIALGLFISTRMRSSITSIIVCLFIWVSVVFIIPNLSVYAAQSFVKVRSQENLDSALGELNTNFSEKRQEYRERITTPDIWFMHFNHNSGGDGFRELAGTAKKTYEFYRQLNVYSEPLRVDYADKKWPIQKAYLDELENQQKLAEVLSLLSPSEVFRLAASSLSGTDVDAHYKFLNRTRIYREELIQFFKEEKIFDSFLYFTRVPPEKFKTADEIMQISTEGQFQTVDEYRTWAQNRSDIFSVFKVRLPEPETRSEYYSSLDLSNVPKFQFKPNNIMGDLKNSLTKIAALIIVSILLFYLSFISFVKYDVR